MYIVLFKKIKPSSLDLFNPGHIRFSENIFYAGLRRDYYIDGSKNRFFFF